jgi:hypothetical protein
MKKKAKTGRAKAARKRSATKDLTARKSRSVKGGLLPAVKQLPAVLYSLGDGSVRTINTSLK